MRHGAIKIAAIIKYLFIFIFLVLYVHINRMADDDDDELMLNVLRCQLTY